MTKYREILRLTALGLSQRNIVQSIGVSQKTVVKVQKRAREMHLSWPLLAPGDRDHILSGVFNQFLSALTEPVE